jgi:hypothetical protein
MRPGVQRHVDAMKQVEVTGRRDATEGNQRLEARMILDQRFPFIVAEGLAKPGQSLKALRG